jgi:cytochrome c2
VRNFFSALNFPDFQGTLRQQEDFVQRRSLGLVSLLIGLCLVITACGGGESTTTTTTTTTTAAPTATPTTAADTTSTTTTTTDTPATAKTGEEVFAGGICITCHKVAGVATTVGVLGPELTNIGTVAVSRVSGLSAEAYIRQSIEEPAAYIVDTYQALMPAGLEDTISPEEYELLIGYLVGLK